MNGPAARSLLVAVLTAAACTQPASPIDAGGAVPTPALRINERGCEGAGFVEVANAGGDDVVLGALTLGAGATIAARTWTPFARVVVTVAEPCTAALSLRDERGALLDEVAPPPALSAGDTWSRLPDLVGDFTVGAFTRGAPNAARGGASDPRVALFSRDAPIEVEIEPDEATVVIDGVRHPARVAFDSSAGDIDVDFQGALVHGLRSLRLASVADDDTGVRAMLASAVLAAVGVPGPRAALARVVVDGGAPTILTAVEPYDDVFLAHAAGGTRHLFLARGADLDESERFELAFGDAPDAARQQLRALAAAIAAAPADGYDEDPVLARLLGDDVLRALASERVIAHEHGYAVAAERYGLRIDDDGRAHLLPTDVDAAFAAQPDAAATATLFAGRALLQTRCARDASCAARYLAVLVDVEARLSAARDALAARAAQGASIVAAARGVPIPGVAVRALLDRLDADALRVAREVACRARPNVDVDRDGHACAADCEEGRADVFLGSTPDACPIAHPCPGIAAADCPLCDVIEVEDLRLAACGQTAGAALPFDEATEACRRRGGALFPISRAGVDRPLALVLVGPEPPTALAQPGRPRWLGATDRLVPGHFLSLDGTSSVQPLVARGAAGARCLLALAPTPPTAAAPPTDFDVDHLVEGDDCGLRLPYLCTVPAAVVDAGRSASSTQRLRPLK